MAKQYKILTRLPLVEANVILEPEDWDALVTELLSTLKVDIPILNFLQASELATAFEVHENRLWLMVMMVEASQIHLECAAAIAGNQTGRKFAEEVAEAAKQMGNVEWRTREAIGEGRSPLDTNENDPSMSSTRSVRERVKRHVKAGCVYLPAFPYAKEFDIGPTPMLLPRGPVVKIFAGVERMEKLQATLTRVSFVGEDAIRIVDIPGISKCKKLVRTLDKNHLEWGARMHKAMDTDGLVLMEVSVVLDWVTASALSFQLRVLLKDE